MNKKKKPTFFNDKNLKTDNKHRADMIELWCEFSPYQYAFFYNNPLHQKLNIISAPFTGKINLLGKQVWIEMWNSADMTDFVEIILWAYKIRFKAYFSLDKKGKEVWKGSFDFDGNNYLIYIYRNMSYYYYYKTQPVFVGIASCSDKKLENAQRELWDVRLKRYIAACKKKNEYKLERYRFLKKELPF